MVAYDLKNDYNSEFDENVIPEQNTNLQSNSAYNDLINTNPELDEPQSTKFTLSEIDCYT